MILFTVRQIKDRCGGIDSNEDFTAFCWDILGRRYLKNINGHLLVGTTVLHRDVSRDLYRIVLHKEWFDSGYHSA